MSDNIKVGAVIYIQELTPFWIEQAKKANIDVLGFHPIGGKEADRHLKEAIELSKTDEFKANIAALKEAGIGIEYEMHALSLMVPRELFAEKPEWFRMDENGQRVADFNVCASNPEVLEHITKKAAELTELFPSSTHDYHFWIDDVEVAKCNCPHCRELSASEQALIIYNAIARGVKQVDKEGKQCYLAYCATLEVPKNVKPEDNIFLEYAPIHRELNKTIFDATSEKNMGEIAQLDGLLDYFGRDTAKVLEYWLDNSLLSGWKLPIKPFTLTPDIINADVKFYREKGFSKFTTFACYLGDEYVAENDNIPDIVGYTEACRK